MPERVVYAGRDLEAMSFAENYHRWILERFAPYLGARVVEVGAGTGGFSELLLARPLESLTLVEPSETMHAALRGRLAELQPRFAVKTYQAIFAEVAAEIRRTQQPDSLIYVNVLEHIADDRAELSLIYETLDAGGRAFIFVPALRWLYGSFDKEIGHYRRYTLPELEEKCREAGFRILDARYFDLAGIVPWWIKYRLLKSDKLEAGAVKLYDAYVVPLAKRAEALLRRPPLGKNVCLIAERA